MSGITPGNEDTTMWYSTSKSLQPNREEQVDGNMVMLDAIHIVTKALDV